MPNQFVLKLNNSGAGWFISICKDKSTYDYETAKVIMAQGMADKPGMDVCDYQYQYITPQIYAEEYIHSVNSGEKYELQFFCFNGKAKHILLRNDLGDASANAFAISYSMNWDRVQDRVCEDMTINVPRPTVLNEMVEIAEKLAKPFPHVRVDFYLVDDRIIFGELTFTTSGKVLVNYKKEVLKQWGDELILPHKLRTKWSKTFNR